MFILDICISIRKTIKKHPKKNETYKQMVIENCLQSIDISFETIIMTIRSSLKEYQKTK